MTFLRKDYDIIFSQSQRLIEAGAFQDGTRGVQG